MCSIIFRRTSCTYAHFGESVLLPTRALQQSQHLDVGGCRTFFSGLICFFVFDILQIPTLWLWACSDPCRVQLKCDGTREGKWRGNWRMEWVASTLHTISEHGVSNITTADAHTSAASRRLNWRPRRFKLTRPFRWKTKFGFCACAITFQTQFTKPFDSTSQWNER
jgi:hypothetical protein